MKFDCRFLCQMFECYIIESEHVRSVNASQFSHAYRIFNGLGVYSFSFDTATSTVDAVLSRSNAKISC